MSPAEKLKVCCIVGTRPEAIKMAPVIQRLAKHDDCVQVFTVSTGQHKEMLAQVLQLFQIAASAELDIMRAEQSLEDILIQTLSKLPGVLKQIRPDVVLVQGDTSTAFIAGLCAFYQKLPVAHVEAGLRSGNKTQPFPEEMNRSLISRVADLHFAPTQGNRRSLLHEGIDPQSITVTGNTVIDALLTVAQLPAQTFSDARLAEALERPTRKILLTAHRRENWGRPLQDICAAVAALVKQFSDVEVLVPVHPNPQAKNIVGAALGGVDRVLLTEPLNYASFVAVQKRSYLILTDSGGVQEEAPSLGIPVLVLREVTERPEAVAAGCVQVIGTRTETILAETSRLLTDPQAYKLMASAVNPYGDGKASERIADALMHHFGLRKDRAVEFAP